MMLTKEDVEIYSKEYYFPIYKYCMSKLSNHQDAEDATQETFMIFSQKGHMLEEQHIKAWLFAVAHNMIMKEYKRRLVAKDKKIIVDEAMTEHSKRIITIEESLVDYYFERFEDEIYSRLTDKEKLLYDLYSDGNIKTGQISQIMGLEPHACSMRKKRLKDKCKEIMLEILFY